MPRSLSPAQIANQVTFLLKGHLKNARIGYIRAAKLLARVRDEKLWKALKFPDIEAYARQDLGLGRSSLYHYLQVHDWLRDYHPAWLERRPKGFIPEISDIGMLVWIEKRLRTAHLPEPLRKELEALRAKAMTGKLTEREFREFRDRGRRKTEPLRVLLRRLRSIRRFAVAIPKAPPDVIAAIEEAIRKTEAALDASHRIVRHATVRHLRLAAR